MPYSAKAVANFFLELANAKGESISPMKLQKLVYYASGWYAGHTGKPLINETIEAWQYGPVVPSLYHEFKRFGAGAITAKARDFQPSVGFVEVAPPPDPAIRGFLENVWKSYGQYTGIKLSEMSHAAGGPWDETRKANPGISGADIPLDWITAHFKAAVENSKHA